eukprot:365118-Chlamydomonas_euryale.AAC.4
MPAVQTEPDSHIAVPFRFQLHASPPHNHFPLCGTDGSEMPRRQPLCPSCPILLPHTNTHTHTHLWHRRSWSAWPPVSPLCLPHSFLTPPCSYTRPTDGAGAPYRQPLHDTPSMPSSPPTHIHTLATQTELDCLADGLSAIPSTSRPPPTHLHSRRTDRAGPHR